MTRLDKIDRAGVAVVALFGTLFGLMIAGTSDTTLRASVLFPALAAGFVAAKAFGFSTRIIVCGLANGATYGTVWYAWLRLVNGVISRIPRWSKRVAIWLIGMGR